MKKFFILAAAVITLAACSSEEENLQTWNGEIRLSYVDVIQTRATQGIQSETFDGGQTLDVFIYEDAESPETTYNNPLEYTTNNDGSLTAPSTQYYPQSGNGVNIFAVYPAGKATDDDVTNKTEVAFEVSADQSNDANYKASDLMVGAPKDGNAVAKTANSVQLLFKHCLSKININVNAGEGLYESDLQGAIVTILGTSTKCTFEPQSGAVSFVPGGTSIIAGELEVQEDTGVQGISAIVVPQSVTEDFIQIELGGGQQTQTPTATKLVYTLPAGSNLEFKGGHSYTFNITAKKTGLTLNSSNISNWEENDGDTYSGDATLQP